MRSLTSEKEIRSPPEVAQNLESTFEGCALRLWRAVHISKKTILAR